MYGRGGKKTVQCIPGREQHMESQVAGRVLANWRHLEKASMTTADRAQRGTDMG